MSDDTMIRDMAERLFAEIATPADLARHDAGEWLGESWAEVAELGFPMALCAEEQGGLDPVEALGLVRLAGRHALPLPLAETMLANRLLTDAGLPVADGPATVAIDRGGRADPVRLDPNWRMTGTAHRVPWARHAARIVVVAGSDRETLVASVPADELEIEHGHNLAGEPRDTVRLALDLDETSVAPLPGAWNQERAHRLGAALRASAMAGALARCLELSVAYAGERVQFGKPIGRFQAIQQSLAAMAGHAAAASAAADLAAEAIGTGGDLVAVASAKIRAGEAAGQVAAAAHQIHGAIGFTREHALNLYTRRLWSWRDEFGDETEWSLALGRVAIEAGPDGCWPLITAA